MEASLTCAVCLGIFRDPVTLPRCSHNFCKRCVQKCAASCSLLNSSVCQNVICPLCRMVSLLPGGIQAIPINKTLIELVRLLPQSKTDKESQTVEATCGDHDPITGGSDKAYCDKHPEFKLELFCKNCKQACCGKCVSQHHQGIFHNVNLLDIIFQEEKLVFFNSLKTLSEIHARLTKEILDDERKYESIIKANEDKVTAAFCEVQKALDLKKQQLLDFVKQQRSTFKNYCQIQQAAKVHHKMTAENIIKDCEAIVDDNEPRSFLEAACGLNTRMKSNLELLAFCADLSTDLLVVEPQYVEVQAVMDAVSALKITSNSKNLNGENGSFSFTSMSRTWDREMTTNKKYCPVEDQELTYLQGQIQKMSIRFVCITKMAEYQHLSYEELRLQYYELSTVQEREDVSAPESPFVCSNVNNLNFSIRSAKSTKPKRKYKRKDHVFACALEEGPSSSSEDMTTNFTSDSKALFQNFHLRNFENGTIRKTGENAKSYRKSAHLAKFQNTGSVASTSAMADRCANMFSNVITEENTSVITSSSEELYDASCNVDPDVEQPREQSNSHNSANDHELSSSQGSPP